MKRRCMGSHEEEAEGGGNLQKFRYLETQPSFPAFDDEASADVALVLRELQASDGSSASPCCLELPAVRLYLHSRVLSRCKYFAALLSDRWRGASITAGDLPPHIATVNMTVLPSRGFAPYLAVLRLLYTRDCSRSIPDVAAAISYLPIAAELLFDECVTACTRFLEAVPWTPDEEKLIVELAPSLLPIKQSARLLRRILPPKHTAVEDMLHKLVYVATHSHPNGATVKGFVALLLANYASRSAVRSVLDNAFVNSLKTVKDSVEEYSSPNVRGRYDEIEALQRMNLHTASVSVKHLLWLLERMIELRVADNAVKEWSEQGAFTANLQRVIKEDALRSIAPGFPILILRCTGCLANAMATGSVIASRQDCSAGACERNWSAYSLIHTKIRNRLSTAQLERLVFCRANLRLFRNFSSLAGPKQVRKNLVKDWLPVLIVTKEASVTSVSGVKLLLEFEDLFLRIISTLPFQDVQNLLPECLNFATRNAEDCSHLVSAFDTWFRRASSIQTPNNDDDDDDDKEEASCSDVEEAAPHEM